MRDNEADAATSAGLPGVPGLRETLQACDPPVRRIYALLATGWHAAGGAVEVRPPGRIYLKLTVKTGVSGHAEPGPRVLNLAALTTREGRRGPAIDLAWDLAGGRGAYLSYTPQAVAEYEAAVRSLPGYSQGGVVHRLNIGQAFREEHAQKLLATLLALKAAA